MNSKPLMAIVAAVFLLLIAGGASAGAQSSGGVGSGSANSQPGKKAKPLTKWRAAQSSFYGRGTFRGYCGRRFVSERALVVAHQRFRCGQKIEFRRPGGKATFIARVVDRGPFSAGREFDLSWKLAQKMRLINKGVGPVRYRLVR
jgi:rare lipoprotein A